MSWCDCKKFVTDMYHPSTKFNNKDPCANCGHSLKDHPEAKGRIKK